MEPAGFYKFADAAASLGKWILALAGTIFVADMIALVVYTIRNGESDESEGKVVADDRPLMPPPVAGPTTMTAWTKRKVLLSKGGIITDDSLVDGSATFAERLAVLGIIVAVTSFFLLFVGASLLLLPFSLFILAIPAIFYYNFTRAAWRGRQRAKRRFAARRRRGQAGE